MRWADLDQLGHVNNVVYVDYLQEARVDMLRAHGRGPEALAEGRRGRAPRGDLPRAADLRLPPGDDRVLGHRIGPRRSRWPTRSSTRTTDGDRSVYLRATTVLTPYVFDAGAARGGSPPRSGPSSRGTSSRTSSRGAARRRCPSRWPATTRSTSASPTSTSTGTSTTSSTSSTSRRPGSRMIARAGRSAARFSWSSPRPTSTTAAVPLPRRALRLPGPRSRGSAPGR